MGEMMNEGQNLGNDIDLSQFYSIFFEEAGENLDQMEQMLHALDLEKADDEELNAIFRCAHSIKGGAATFGFADVAAPPLTECAQRKMALSSSSCAAATSSASSICSI